MKAHWLGRCPKSIQIQLYHTHYITSLTWNIQHSKKIQVPCRSSGWNMDVTYYTQYRWLKIAWSQSPYVSIQPCHTWCYCNPLFNPETFLWLAPKNQELTSMTKNKGLYIIPNLAFYKMLNNPPPNRGHWTSPSKIHPSLISMWCFFGKSTGNHWLLQVKSGIQGSSPSKIKRSRSSSQSFKDLCQLP